MDAAWASVLLMVFGLPRCSLGKRSPNYKAAS